MTGFITQKEVEENRDFIVATWGEEVYNACMNAAEGTTFLGLLTELGAI